MRVERGDLIHFSLRESHLFSQSSHVGGRQVTKLVLNQVQMLDKQVSTTLFVAQQGRDIS
jgi:hypothetical protein